MLRSLLFPIFGCHLMWQRPTYGCLPTSSAASALSSSRYFLPSCIRIHAIGFSYTSTVTNVRLLRKGSKQAECVCLRICDPCVCARSDVQNCLSFSYFRNIPSIVSSFRLSWHPVTGFAFAHPTKLPCPFGPRVLSEFGHIQVSQV